MEKSEARGPKLRSLYTKGGNKGERNSRRDDFREENGKVTRCSCSKRGIIWVHPHNDVGSTRTPEAGILCGTN
ncbi:hypothetical protein CEXT_182441 [Caerostris extrusa]|uniref:Uncharacterized protein n=1 Tax=Caerostris extrusa TaxID=172846 RepID=A0AAV4MC22_CAEEX|nr:hypothetical protein CEXT_182441 [Caerostris extrusa]